MSMPALPSLAPAGVLSDLRPRGTFLTPWGYPSLADRFSWTLKAPGAGEGWVVATDAVAARAAAEARKGKAVLYLGRLRRGAGLFAWVAGIVLAAAPVPVWSAVAQSYPESTLGGFAAANMWVPFVVMAAMTLGLVLMAGGEGVPDPVVPGAGQVSPWTTAFLLTDAGVSVLRRDDGGPNRHDVLATSVTRVATRTEDAGHVTVTLSTPDGDLVMPWLPDAAEVTGTVAAWGHKAP